MTKTHGAALIVDASESGCGAHGNNYWGFDGQADYLVFGKRAYAEGFYSRPQSKTAAITFGGDMLRLM
jgi:4-aminobutyrate aminotransferase-like enzyme